LLEKIHTSFVKTEVLLYANLNAFSRANNLASNTLIVESKF